MATILTIFKSVDNFVETSRNIDAAAARLESLTSGIDKFSRGAKAAGAGLTVALTAPIVAVGAAAIKLGMDAVESENLVAVSFGDMKGAATDWSRSLSASLGLNQFELRKTAGTLFNMTTSMGLGREAAFEMSTGVTKLAADMASFRNIPMEEALRKIQSGLTGEAEPLKAIGVLVDDATIKTYAYTHGIAKQGSELTQQQKVLARWGAILQQTANDQGDLERTLDSPANKLRTMRTRIDEAATSLGVALIPMVSKIIGRISDLVPYIQKAVDWFTKLPAPVKEFAVGAAIVVAALGPVVYILGTLAGAVSALLPVLAGLGVTAGGAAAVFTGVLLPALLVVATAAAAVWAGLQIGEKSGITDWIGKKLAGAFYGVSEAEYEASRAGAKVVGTQIDLVTQTKHLQGAMVAEAKAQQGAALAAQGHASAQKEAERAAKQHADAIANLVKQFSGAGILQQARDYEVVLKKLGGASALTTAEQKTMYEAFDKVIEKYKRLGPAGADVVAHFEALQKAAFPVPKEIGKVSVALETIGTRVDLKPLTLDFQRFTLSIEDLGRQGRFNTIVLKDMESQIATLPNVVPLATEKIEEATVALEHAGKSSGAFGRAFTDTMKSIPGIIQNAFTGGGGLSGALQAIGSKVGSEFVGAMFATGKDGSAIGNGLAKMLPKAFADAVPMIGAAIGAAIGPLISLIAGLFDHKGKDIMRDVGKGYGVQITDGLKDAIKKDVRGSVGEVEAALLHMADIVKEAGGVTAANFGTFVGKLHDVFSAIETHQLTVAQGAKIIDDNWKGLAVVGVDAFGRISDKLKEIIALDARLGTQSKEIAAFLKSQGLAAAEGFNAQAAALAPQLAGWDAIRERIDIATKARAKFDTVSVIAFQYGPLPEIPMPTAKAHVGTTDLDKVREAYALLGLEIKQSLGDDVWMTAIAGADGFRDKLGDVYMEGLTPVERSMTRLRAEMGKSLDAGAMFDTLAQANKLIEANEKAKGAITTMMGALTNQMGALNNHGRETVGMFRSQEAVAVSMYGRMQTAVSEFGGTTKDALVPMQGFLRQAADEALRLHVPLGATTQLLIAQSKELGLWQDTAADKAMAAADAVIAAQKNADAARQASAAGRAVDLAAADAELAAAIGAQAEAAAAAKQQLDDLGVSAMSAYGAAIAGGMSHAEAVTKIGPGLTNLQKAYKDLGLGVDDVALQSLMMANTIQTSNPLLMSAIGGLTGEMVALDNMGRMNEKTFGAMERTAFQMYQRLQSETKNAGGTARDALVPMQEYLHNAEIQAKNLGIPLDANTRMLIDQSRELGVWKEAGKTANEKLLDGIEKLVTKMDAMIDRLTGGDSITSAVANMKAAALADLTGAGGVTSALQTVNDKLIGSDSVKTSLASLGSAASLVIGGISSDIGKIPRNVKIDFDGRFNPPDIPDEFAAVAPMFSAMHMAEGGTGRVTGPTLFLAGEAGDEDFAFSGGGKRFNKRAGADGGASSSEMLKRMDMLIAENQAMRREQAMQRRLLPKQIRDAVLLAT